MQRTVESELIHVGRTISSGELGLIQETVELFPALSRTELAETLCDHLGWYTASGTRKGRACQELLERLEALVAAVKAERRAPAAELDALIRRFTAAYADAQHEHRVLTEDVKFLHEAERAQVEGGQRRVVAVFASAIARVRPDLASLATPLAMLLFGMINWTFTWMRSGGALTHQALAPIVAELFFGGLQAVAAPAAMPKKRRARSAAAVV